VQQVDLVLDLESQIVRWAVAVLESQPLRWVTTTDIVCRLPWTGSWTGASANPSAASAISAITRVIRAARAHCARGRPSHNPPVVCSRPGELTALCGASPCQMTIGYRERPGMSPHGWLAGGTPEGLPPISRLARASNAVGACSQSFGPADHCAAPARPASGSPWVMSSLVGVTVVWD
jgi:hypothetical protein